MSEQIKKCAIKSILNYASVNGFNEYLDNIKTLLLNKETDLCFSLLKHPIEILGYFVHIAPTFGFTVQIAFDWRTSHSYHFKVNTLEAMDTEQGNIQSAFKVLNRFFIENIFFPQIKKAAKRKITERKKRLKTYKVNGLPAFTKKQLIKAYYDALKTLNFSFNFPDDLIIKMFKDAKFFNKESRKRIKGVHTTVYLFN